MAYPPFPEAIETAKTAIGYSHAVLALCCPNRRLWEVWAWGGRDQRDHSDAQVIISEQPHESFIYGLGERLMMGYCYPACKMSVPSSGVVVIDSIGFDAAAPATEMERTT